MNPTFHRALLLTAALAAPAAWAQTPAPAEPESTLAWNIGAVSDYRVRGLSQTSFRPALQGGVDFTHKSGFYVGSFASNVRWLKDLNGATKGSAEVDFYGGFRGTLAADWSYDAGVIRYEYVRNNTGDAGTPGAGLFTDASTTEAYLNVGFKMFNLKYSRSLGDFLGNIDSSGSQYLDLNGTFPVSDGLNLTAHVGRQTIPNQGATGNAGDYTDWSLSLAKDFGNGLVATVTAGGTNAAKGPGSFYRDMKGRDLGRNYGLVGVKYSF